MKHWLLIFAITINHGIFMCYAVNSIKNDIITEIVQKSCSMAKGTLTLANDDEKAKILRDLEEKLESTNYAELPDRNVYAKMVMEGIKTMVLNNENDICNRNISDIDINMILKEHNISNFRRSSGKKKEMLKTISGKIESLVKKALDNKTTVEDKDRAISNVKGHLMKQYSQSHSLKNQSESNKMMGLILEGVEVMRLKYENNHNRRLESNDNIDDSNVGTTPNLALTLEDTCDAVSTKTCTNLKALDQHVCTYDDTVISVQKICDGIVDCPDASDEKDCIKQAVRMVHAAGDVMSKIVMYKHCFRTLTENSILSQQGAMLSAVLQRQLEFINKFNVESVSEKYSPQGNPTTMKLPESFRDDLSAFTTEVSLVMKTFVVAVHGALCMDLEKEADIATKISEIDDLEEEEDDRNTWSPKSCACHGKLCLNATCGTACRRFCYEKFALNRWTCKAASGEGSVSFNLVCDGKYDCLDESDEINCAVGAENSPEKFEAAKIYNDILFILKSKIMSKEYESVSNQFRQLHEAIKTIHIASKRPTLNSTFFRNFRDKCFEIITSIYVDFLEVTANAPSDNNAKVQDTFEFLLSLGEKLMNAMKLSNTGNPKAIFFQGCDCKGNQCNLPACSKRCTRYCAVVSILTEYSCGSSPNDTRVPVHHICNGKPGCPNGEDEKNCNLKEICRRHQLVVLRHNIQNAGKQYKGTILGDVLDTWKSRVISTIVVTENAEQKLTPRTFKETVSGFLYELVNTYVSLQDLRKLNSDHVLKKFEKLAQRLMESLKSCGK